MSTRWARNALCTLAVTLNVIVYVVVASPLFLSPAEGGASVRPGNAAGAPLTLVSQSSWVTPQQPWFNLSLGVGDASVPASQLQVNLTFYNRIDDESQFAQTAGGVPQNGILARDPGIPVTEGASGRVANACVTVARNSSETPPSGGTGACPAGDDTTLVLGCTPEIGRCGDVYPVSVALVRQGSGTTVARFTTYLTYQETGAGTIGTGGPLRVGVVLPVTSDAALDAVAAASSDHHDVPTTLAIDPRTVEQTLLQHSRDGSHALAELAALDQDQVTEQPYVPIDVASLAEAGIAGEITNQVARGDALLRQAGLKPSGGPWVDTVSGFNQGDGPALATGVQVTGAVRLVVSDGDLSTAGLANYTYAQPFTLDLGRDGTATATATASGTAVPAAASDSSLSARFTAQQNDPVLGAEQLLAGLHFVHFENAFLDDHRGVIVEPPANWRPSATFLETLLSGLSGNPALTPVTLDQYFTQVPAGGNREPAVRHLQSGPASGGINKTTSQKIATARIQLGSYCCGAGTAVDARPPEMATLSDALLGTEARSLSTAGRTTAINAYERAFAGQVDKITIATERTVTFTSGRAPIPITVLNGAAYPVTVVMTLASDEFTFPNGNTRTLLLDRPTTSVRVVAQARSSGGRLPIDVTLRTPDGQLLLARTELTVHSTAISFVGVALTVLAGIVLIVWWARTWRRSRRARRRAH
ncbi:MAG TPA: DUF6049 family protein [Acidimicrobiales bacterium]